MTDPLKGSKFVDTSLTRWRRVWHSTNRFGGEVYDWKNLNESLWNEMNDSTKPHEAGVAWTVAKDKLDFIGKTAMMEHKTELDTPVGWFRGQQENCSVSLYKSVKRRSEK